MAAFKGVIQSGLRANLIKLIGFDASKVSVATAYSAESFRWRDFDASKVSGVDLSSNRYDSRYDRRNISHLASKVSVATAYSAESFRWRGFDASKLSGAAAYSAESFRFDGSSMYLRSYVSSNRYDSRYNRRNISQQAGKRLFLVDTLALVRKMEAQGIPSKHSEAITTVITEVLNDSLENVAESFVTKTDMQKSEMLQDANLAKFKSEVQNSQEHHFSMLQRETEKLKSDIDKIRSELRYEIDKVTAGQRLDLNLERGRIRDELSNQNAETTNLTNKLDREIHGLRAQLEATKYEVIKYCIGTLVSISAVGLALLRILL